MDVVLRPLEDAVLVDIPRLHAVCSRRTGVEQVNDLICAPWPEHSRVQSIVNTQIDLYLWGPTWVGHGRTVLPCLWIIPNGVIKRVKHSSGLIEISHEKVLMIIDGIMPGLWCRQLNLGHQRPITGRLRQLAHWSGSKHIFVPPAYIGDGVIGTIVAADHIAFLRHILRAVCWQIDGAICVPADCSPPVLP